MFAQFANDSLDENSHSSQLRELLKIDHPEIDKLRLVLKEFRDEELEHLDTAVDHDAKRV